MDYPVQRVVKCGVLIHPADNLEAHGVGGFCQSFSGPNFCRFCHINHSDLLERIHDYCDKPHAKWTVEEYNKAAQVAENKKKSLESVQYEESSGSSDEDDEGDDCAEEELDDDEDEPELFGVKHRCPLNSLEAFHCITAFPPDVLHDLLEGVVSQDLLGIIRIFSFKKWFTLEEYNNSLEELSFRFSEAADRPQGVPMSKKVSKLRGKACSLWVHMRNFPLIIRKYVNGERGADPVLMLGLLLHEVTERLTASSFEDYEIHLLEEKIIEFLDLRRQIYEEFPLLGSPKPKTHFLTHYAQAIRLCGPPLSYWTARYESRHRIAKNTAESAKNFKNISLTVSTRQQMRQSSVFYHNMFETSDLIISGKTTFKSELKGDTDFEKAILPYMDDQDFLVSEIEFKSQIYRPGQLVVVEMFNADEIKVGLVTSILVKSKSVFFVTKQFVAARNYLQYFKAESDDPTLTLDDASKLVDYKPLINHGTASQLFFCLHHHISYKYD